MMWLLACVPGAAPVDVDKDPVSEPVGSPPPPTEATQIFDDGTGTCIPQTLSDSVVLPLGRTVGDVLAMMRVERVSPVWFDGRAVDLTVSLVRTGEPVTVDMGCEVRVPIELSFVSDDGAVQQLVLTEASLNDSVSAWMKVESADWMGTLASSTFLDEPCPEGESWRLDVDQGDGEGSGYVRHSCDNVVVDDEDPETSGDTGTTTTTTHTDTDGPGPNGPGTLTSTLLTGDTGDTGPVEPSAPSLEVLTW